MYKSLYPHLTNLIGNAEGWHDHAVFETGKESIGNECLNSLCDYTVAPAILVHCEKHVAAMNEAGQTAILTGEIDFAANSPALALVSLVVDVATTRLRAGY